ncbi:hypothetical protein MBT84_00970 [Streptomyces sp. MBT84]|nr:hypothetical protein [Streptomyces sp. MBT84]
MRQNGVHSLMVVPLVANHVALGLVAFYRCQGSSPFRQSDLRAATNLVKQTALVLDAIRRGLREQAMGRRFQRALLGQPPHLTAVEEVDGHVPVNGPRGGWFDVIPLPSARVGLVAGVCGGHGITAAAAMSQQKAQVRVLAVQDIDPVEGLSRVFQLSAHQSEYTAQPGAPKAMQEIYNAEDRAHAEQTIEAFEKTYGAKWPKAVSKITDDAEELLAFYDFPAQHCLHLRTTNPIESTFATVKLRTKVTRGPGSPAAALSMVFKLVESAQARWRAVTGAHLVPLVRAGARFENGVLVEREEAAA